MTNETLRYKLAINLIPGIGSINAKRIIAYTGSIEGLFLEKYHRLIKIPGVGEILAKQIVNHSVFDRVDEEIEFIEKEGIRVFFFLDKDYPERLKHCVDCPVVFFVKGDTNLNSDKILSIVGTRNATAEGRENCEKLIEGLIGHNPLIVSGLAFGIDICAHKAALKYGLKTVAVLGHGLDTIYPAQHQSIADKIIDQGALLTDFYSNSLIDRQNFVKRNRIVAGLADATIVIESGVKGGALITAEIANSYNRDVFAFPGRINDKYSVGCNQLIKQNKAALIENHADIEFFLGWKTIEKKDLTIQASLFEDISEEEKIIVDTLSMENELNIDIIALRSKMQMSKVSSLLLNLEFKGLVKSLPGKVYAIRRK